MEAGRDMDALVAEKVMGLPVKDGWIFETSAAGCSVPGCFVYHNEQAPVRPPAYSNDIAAAWAIIEKMKGVCSITKRASGSYIFRINTYSYKTGLIQAEAPTAPLAICRAALQAVEGR